MVWLKVLLMIEVESWVKWWGECWGVLFIVDVWGLSGLGGESC